MLSDLEPLRNGVDDSTGKPVPKADPATGTTKSCGDRPSHAPPAVGEPDARADSGRRPLLVSRCSQLPESSPSGCPSLYGHWAPVHVPGFQDVQRLSGLGYGREDRASAVTSAPINTPHHL